MARWLRFLRWWIRNGYLAFEAAEGRPPGLATGDGVRILSPHRLTVGDDVYIDSGAYIHCGDMDWCKGQGRIAIGRGTYIGPQCVVFGMGEVEIGEQVMISPNVVITSVQHPYADTSRPMYEQARRYEKIVIGDDVYIGSNAVVTPGVTIGRGAVVGAGAVVTKNVEPYGIAVGVPAVVTRRRTASEDR